MKIKVKYFASLKESIGRSEESLEISDNSTVLELWHQISQPLDVPGDIKMAVNMEYVNQDKQLQDGDEVAFFPPVTGG